MLRVLPPPLACVPFRRGRGQPYRAPVEVSLIGGGLIETAAGDGRHGIALERNRGLGDGAVGGAVDHEEIFVNKVLVGVGIDSKAGADKVGFAITVNVHGEEEGRVRGVGVCVGGEVPCAVAVIDGGGICRAVTLHENVGLAVTVEVAYGHLAG